MNRPVTVIDCEEEVMASSPNSTLSSLSGKRNERDENDGERATSSLEEEDGGEAARKKLRLSKEQAAVLEETFKEHNTLSPVSGIFGKFFSGSMVLSVLILIHEDTRLELKTSPLIDRKGKFRNSQTNIRTLFSFICLFFSKI